MSYIWIPASHVSFHIEHSHDYEILWGGILKKGLSSVPHYNIIWNNDNPVES